MAFIPPPAGINPVTDWSSYASSLSSDADTDKKRTAAAVAGTALLTKTILDSNLVKNTANNIAKIENEKNITSSLINKRFTERGKLISDIEGRGGKVNVSINDNGDAIFNIDNKEKVRDSLRIEEIALATTNIPLKGYSNDRKISAESRKEAIRKADLRFTKLVDQQKLYDWKLKTKEEAQAAVEPLYRGAKLSLNKARYRDTIAKKFTQLTGSYVENPQDVYLKEARNSIEKLYNLRDTEYSNLVSNADKKAQEESDAEYEEILNTLINARDNTNLSEKLRKEASAKIELLEDPPEVQPLSPDVNLVTNFLAGANNGLYGKEAMDNPAKASTDFMNNYKTQSLIADGNHDSASLYLASLPVKENSKIINFYSPSERVKLLTERDVNLFIEREDANPTYSNVLAQAEYVDFTSRKIQNVTTGGVATASGTLNYKEKPLDASVVLAYQTKMYGHLKREKIDQLIALENIKVTPENRTTLASQKLSLEYSIATLAEQYKNVNKGNAYDTFNALLNTNKARLLNLKADTFDGRLSSSLLKNNADLIQRTLTNIKDVAEISGNSEKQKVAQEFLDSESIKSVDTIARILTLADMTAAYGNSGNVTAQWYRREGVMIEDILYDIAVELDRTYDIPNITEAEK